MYLRILSPILRLAREREKPQEETVAARELVNLRGSVMILRKVKDAFALLDLYERRP